MVDRAGQFGVSWKFPGGHDHGYDRTAQRRNGWRSCTGVSPRALDDASAGSIPWGICRDCFWPKVARVSNRWPWSSAGRRRTSWRSSSASSWLGSGSSRFLLGRLRPCNKKSRRCLTRSSCPRRRQWPIGTVGVIDGSGFVKHGTESVGVQRQWCGRVGKKENCQVGVFLLGVTPAGIGAFGSPTLPAGDVGCGRRAAEEDPRPAGGDVPDQAADRRGAWWPGVRRASTGSRPTRSSDATEISSMRWRTADIHRESQIVTPPRKETDRRREPRDDTQPSTRNSRRVRAAWLSPA